MAKRNTQHRTADDYVKAIIANRGIISYAADDLGVTPASVYGAIKRYPSVAQALEESRERFVDTAERALLHQVEDGDTTAIIFLLKTLGKKRGYVERSETVTIDATKLHEMTDEELAEAAARAGLK